MSAQYAFPLADPDGPMQQGMTLRDYFAAHADVKTYLEVYAPHWKFNNDQGRFPSAAELAAMTAEYRYAEADAMLKARDEVKP